jgi:hypothetical protein
MENSVDTFLNTIKEKFALSKNIEDDFDAAKDCKNHLYDDLKQIVAMCTDETTKIKVDGIILELQNIDLRLQFAALRKFIDLMKKKK